MVAQVIGPFDFSHWLTWVSLVAGVGVGWLVFTATGRLLPQRYGFFSFFSSEDTLSKREILELFKQHGGHEKSLQEMSKGDLEEVWKLVKSQLPSRAHPPFPEEIEYLNNGAERRAHPRRWFNPTSVNFYAPEQDKPWHGIIVNRSSGGLAILADLEVPAESILYVRAIEAPLGVPAIKVQVRHARRAGPMWLLGCQYTEELPWNVKVWFG